MPTPKPKRKTRGNGNPYTPEERDRIIATVCDRLIAGDSLRTICRAPEMPDLVTVLRWLNDEETYASTVARARDIQADSLDDQIQEITEKMIAKEIDPNTARVAIWALQWRAAKMRPKRYGDRQTIEHDGNVSVQIQRFTGGEK